MNTQDPNPLHTAQAVTPFGDAAADHLGTMAGSAEPKKSPPVSGSKLSLIAGYEPIPGYVLREPIGQGGFGEVWSATAPGGFVKAIKFVYGAQGEKRAGRELRSLELMKGVNHPFLLTLERYEFIEDRLVIVSELADGSLEDVFNRQFERGSCGLPRQALLSYLNDAADALDYLHSEFQLQHLDIKPGNLLLVGGHVKIADFGLLKDLRDVNASMIGGLTPIYAPPEVFDGRPSHHSDQYSLAVMYQELLTGTRPFDGRTIAQLATQHVHSSPNLNPLPPSDRPILARALEKDPERRFPSCRELVEALRAPRGKNSLVTPSGTHQAIGGDTKTGCFSSADGAARPIENLPKLTGSVIHGSESRTANSLVVAIGGTGADVLLELHKRIESNGEQPAERIDSVLIDTDSEKLQIIRALDGPDKRSPCKMLYTPLRTASQYRDSGTKRLQSISRRWIYNVPRSQTTEGIRPLGRLAMVDHGQEILKYLQQAIIMTVGDSPAPPTIYLIGSLTGGTGSGMLLDIAYLLRHLLDENGAEQSEIIPLFASTSACPHPRNPIGNADAAAALNELAFYLKPENSYRGDAGAGFPSVPAARSPLHRTYLISNGEPNEGHASAVKTIADYLWVSSQGAAHVLTAARKEETAGTATMLQIQTSTRSVGLTCLSSDACADVPSLAAMLVRKMLQQWLGHPNEARRLATTLAERVAGPWGFGEDALQLPQWHRWSSLAEQRRLEIREHILDLPINTMQCGGSMESALAGDTEELRNVRPDDKWIAGMMANLRRELSLRLQDRRIDLTIALEVVRFLGEHVESLMVKRSRTNQDRTPPPVNNQPPPKSQASRIEELLCRGIGLAESLLDEAVQAGVTQRLACLRHELSRLATALERQINIFEKIKQQLDKTLQPLSSLLPEAVLHQLETDADVMHNELSGTLLTLPILQPAPAMDESQCLEKLRTTGEKIAHSLLAATGQSSAAQTALSLPEKIEVAIKRIRPALLDLGGKQRLLLLAGSQREMDELRPSIETAYGSAISAAIIPGLRASLVHEAQAIPLDAVIQRLRASLGGNHKLTARLQSRVDIEWPTR